MCNKCGNISSHRCGSARPCGCSDPLNCGCKSKTEFTCVNYTGKHLENIDVLPGYNGDRVLEKIDERVEDLYNQISLIEITGGDEKQSLQDVTDIGNVTTNPVKIQEVWFKNNANDTIFRVKDSTITSNQNIEKSIIDGVNLVPKLSVDKLQHSFHDNYIAGQNILSRLTGIGTTTLYSRPLYNDSNVFIGNTIATSGEFRTSENNTVIGSYVFHDGFGTEDTTFHTVGNTIIGRNIQNHYNMYNKNSVKHPYTKKHTAFNVIIGDNIYANQFHKAVVYGTKILTHSVDNSILIGSFDSTESEYNMEVKPYYRYDKNIILSNNFVLQRYKKEDNVENYLYIGNSEPLMEGDLSSSNRRLKVYGRLQIEGSNSVNNVQGDLSYTKSVVSKPDGTLGLVDKFEALKSTLNSLTPEQKLEIRNILNS